MMRRDLDDKRGYSRRRHARAVSPFPPACATTTDHVRSHLKRRAIALIDAHTNVGALPVNAEHDVKVSFRSLPRRVRQLTRRLE